MAVRRHIQYMRWLYIVFHKKFYFVLGFLPFYFGFGFFTFLFCFVFCFLCFVLCHGLCPVRLRLATRTGISAACLQIWVFQWALPLPLVLV